MNVTFNGNAVTLRGKELRCGDAFPDFIATGNDLGDVRLADTAGIRVFTAVPSLDTPICDLQVRRFNEQCSQMPNVTVYAFSMDLPFAQKRWCGAAGVSSVVTLSDFKYRSFGEASGTYMEEIGLLARAIFILNSEGLVSYAQYVPEVRTPPDMDAAFAALEALASQ